MSGTSMWVRLSADAVLLTLVRASGRHRLPTYHYERVQVLLSVENAPGTTFQACARERAPLGRLC
jgi:hypothetical protein